MRESNEGVGKTITACEIPIRKNFGARINGKDDLDDGWLTLVSLRVWKTMVESIGDRISISRIYRSNVR